MEQCFLFAVNLALVIATLTFLALMFISSCKTGGSVKNVISIIFMVSCCGVFACIFHNQYCLISQGKDISLALFINMFIYLALLFYQVYLYKKQVAENERIRKANELLQLSNRKGA